jgi:hypothetical protein
MKTRYLVDVYKIQKVLEYSDGGADDLIEQTEDQLNRNRDFQYQLQADTLPEIAKKLLQKPSVRKWESD